MAGSMTEGIPDYHDPNDEARRLLGSRKRSDREKGKELLQLMEQQQNRQMHDREFNERQADTRARNLDRQSEAKNKQDQLSLYREQLTEARTNREGDTRAAHLNTLLADPDTKPEIKQAIRNHLLERSGVSGTLPVDPAKVALVRSKNAELQKQGKPLIPEPQGEPFGTRGGGSETTTSAPRVGPTGAQDQGLGFASNGFPVLPNTPEPRFVPLGHNPLEGSTREDLGNGRTQTTFPSGGTATVNSPTQDRSVAGASPDGFNIGDLTSKPAPQQPTTPTPPTPPTPNVAGEAFKRTNQKLGDIGQFLEPLTIAKNAIGGLFSGGQGANELVNQPTNQPTPNPTPAPGTQFQGPVTATAGFLGQPNAPTPPPANTPPAIPPVNKPTPEEERRRLAGQQ